LNDHQFIFAEKGQTMAKYINNDILNTTQKTHCCATRTTHTYTIHTNGGELVCSGKVGSSCSTAYLNCRYWLWIVI